MIVSTYYTI